MGSIYQPNISQPSDFIMGCPPHSLITVTEVQTTCCVDCQTAKKALLSAFSMNILKPVQRKVGSEDWQVHLMAITRLLDNTTGFEIAFVRR
jgi:hypothetical protein